MTDVAPDRLAALAEAQAPRPHPRPRRSAAPATSGAERLRRGLTRFYLVLFFAYLFLPLAIMSAATFNDSRFPTVLPWVGTTTKWFGVLLDDRLMWDALWTSLIVGAGVVAVSLPTGVAAALLLSSLHARARNIVYALMVSPLLTPGVIIGISTLIFWDRAFGMAGGVVLTILAQASFITGYVMLMVLARMQRFDPGLEEAALDLGASHAQVFRRITLPFLMPALGAAAVIAFLQSFENYNTTLFVKGLDTTLTVYLASQVRTGLTPAVNALGVILIGITVAGAVLYEVKRRADLRRQEGR
ncbi:ABC transporter permease [Caenispirillum bisanense]|uniref:ABC transporter permease n=1 Tax=Caenispirillum bisanense TaxID=414052 RepID=UPI0031E1140C